MKDLETQGRLRSLKRPSGLDLSSNDYLGMAGHPVLRRKAIEALEGGMAIGARASRLLGGHTDSHESLEHFAARHFGTEKALFFPTGYQANLGLFGGLTRRSDVIVFDEFIHASAREAIQNSPARHIKFAHNDLQACEDALRRAKADMRAGGQIWLAVESLYSMDGDFADIAALYDLACRYDAVLIVDEAHATGIWGPEGKGLSYGKTTNIITLHTCGKAVGVAGGLICGPAEMIEMIINTARPFIYSTAPIPVQALLVEESLKILAGTDGQERRTRLFALIQYVQRARNDLMCQRWADSQIVPIILGSDKRAVAVAQALQAEGYDVRAIRPPTVPENTARLRLSLSCEISSDTMREFFNALTAAAGNVPAEEKAA